VLERHAAQVVALAGPAFRVGQEFGNDEERNTAHARRRIGRARQHEMHDVLGEVVLAVGDEDLLASHQVMIAALDRTALQLAQVRARLRFGEVHRPGPFARDHLGQVLSLLRLGAVMMDGVDRTLVQQQHQAEAHIGRLPHLLHGGRE
jgi:hypothetical protein